MLRPLAVLLLMVASFPVASAPRQIAVTFDDLPDTNAGAHKVEQIEALTTRLVTRVRKAGIPAIGFVNEDKVYDDDGLPDRRRIALLEEWLDAGLELGNHTWSHADLHDTSVIDYECEILRGEELTRPLAAARGSAIRWFRHPYLNAGSSHSVRDAIGTFLADHGYRIAPVTVDDSDWIFALAYDRAVAGHHFFTRYRLSREYIRYMAARLAFAETMSRRVFGREIPQVLLLHASQLNADTFTGLAGMMSRRGYRFVSLDEATEDSAYSSPDSWTGGGVGWIERWAVTAGIPEAEFEDDPEVPEWVQKFARVRE